MPAPKKATAPRLRCCGCNGPLRATHRFCPRCGAPVATASLSAPSVGGPSLQVAAARPQDLAENRRLVTVLFADLSGSTALGERLDPEDLRGILASYFAALVREIQRFEGTVDKYIGDAVMAVFGAPLAHEDDAERAINAALAMQAAMGQLNDELERRYDVRLALRIGINTGEVVAGLLAGEVQGAYTVVGDAVNTAQRFESAAPPGGILISTTTWRLTRRIFDFEALEPLVLKGKTEPQPAYRVLRRREHEIELPATPLVGRERDLARLKRVMELASAGRGHALHISGEAGVGKTRLVSEFRAAVDPTVRQLRARCASFEVETPYALIARMLRDAFGVLAGADEATAAAGISRGFNAVGETLDSIDTVVLLEILAYDERSALDPETKQRVLLSLVRRFFRATSDCAPLLVLAEDVHWVDAASSAVLAELVRDLGSLRCVLVTTGRPGWAAPWPSELMMLDALDNDGGSALIEAVFGAPVEQSLVEIILNRTGGNPFFIEEVVRQFRDSDVLMERDGRIAVNFDAAPRVPATVQEVLTARIDRLPPSVKQVIQPAAVCGRTFERQVLERLAPDLPINESLASLEREGIIVPLRSLPGQAYLFRHALIQEVVYNNQLNSQRRAMHAKVGAALESLNADRLEGIVDELAFHYGRSDNDDKARDYLVRAGQRAQRLYANDQALTYFRAAIERSAQDDESRATASELSGDVQKLTGAYSEAIRSYERALSAQAPTARIARSELLRKLGIVHHLQGNVPAALEAFGEALAGLPAQTLRERARVLIEFGEVLWRQGRYEEAIERLTEAVVDADRTGASDACADAYKQLGTIHVLKGDTRQGLEYYERSREIYESLSDLFGQANVLSNIGIVHRRDGRYAAALKADDDALEIRERIGDPRGIASSRNNRAQVYRCLGDLELAQQDYQAALTIWESIGFSYGVATARTGLGIALVQQGDIMTGRRHLELALKEWQELGGRTYISETECYLAQAYVPDDLAISLEWANRAVETARQLGAVEQEGIALQTLGIVHTARNDTEAAIAAFARSQELLEHTSERHELGRTYALLGKLYLDLPSMDQRSASAEKLITMARAIFRELGAMRDLRLVAESALSR